MRLRTITIILLFLSLSSVVHATSKLVCKLNPRKNEEERRIWLLWIKKGANDYNYISIEGRAYDRVPDWAKRINAIIESKALRITFTVPTVTKEMEGALFCTGSQNRGNILTLRVAPKINNTGHLRKHLKKRLRIWRRQKESDIIDVSVIEELKGPFDA